MPTRAAGVTMWRTPLTSDANSVWEGWGSVILVVGVTGLAMILLIVLAWQGFAVWRARILTRDAIARDDEIRRLADKATTAQQATATELASISEGVKDLRSRVASIEKLLNEVG